MKLYQIWSRKKAYWTPYPEDRQFEGWFFGDAGHSVRFQRTLPSAWKLELAP